MGRFDTYVEAWRRRWEEERRIAEMEARRAWDVAERLARLLGERYGVRRVVLVGSLARGEFRLGSDIDLAAEGVPAGLFFSVGAEIEAAADGFRVDLVRLESATTAFLRRVKDEGVVLYEAGAS